MCLNCGCGEYDTRHKESDIVAEDLVRAAEGHQMEAEQAADNIHQAARELRSQGRIS